MIWSVRLPSRELIFILWQEEWFEPEAIARVDLDIRSDRMVKVLELSPSLCCAGLLGVGVGSLLGISGLQGQCRK
jgi:hypothetical protein